VKDYINLAVINLKHRRLRSWLTILGIVIGIAAVSSLVSINQGLMEAINSQFESMGTNTIMILPGTEGSTSPILNMLGSPLKMSDNDVVENVPGVDYSIPLYYKAVNVEFRGDKKSIFMYAIPSKDGEKLTDLFASVGLKEGRSLKRGDMYKAIVGYNVYKNVFNDKVSVGSYIKIEGKKFKVIGIMNEIGNRMDDNQISIPLEAAREIFGESDRIDMIMVKVEEGRNVEDVAKAIKLKLKNHRGTEDFQVLTSKELLERAKTILGLVSIVFIAVAAISLVVGGIGIMNTMYMAVVERTRHIGVMKAVGARDVDIMMIFLLESGIIGLIGGLIGLSIGLGFAKIVEVYAASAMQTKLLKASFDPLLIVGSLAFSFIVGVISGVMPARAAAKMNPVDALRYE